MALVLSSTGLVSSAGAATLSCGQTITTNTTLENDVGPCSQNGIVIGANNITFNLNGHRVFGVPGQGDGAGVYASGRTGVTIRGGTVTDFDAGVVLDGGSGNTVQQITARDNIGEVSAELTTDFGDGILLRNSSTNRVLQNVAEHNGPYSGITLLGNSDNNILQGNVSRRNDVPGARPGHTLPGGQTMEDDGIRLETIAPDTSPDGNLLTANTVSDNGLDGIAVFSRAKSNFIESNVISGNGVLGTVRPGDGIHVFGGATENLVRGNQSTQNARHGIILDFFDPAVPGRNVVENNTSLQNAIAPNGFQAFDLTDLNRFCDQNIWRANTFNTKNDPGSDCIH